MTKQEVAKLLFVIRANYPESYSKLSDTDMELLAVSWERLLQGYTYAQCDAALQTYLLTDTYGRAPKIGQIIDSIHKVSEAQELNSNQAWALVYKAICRGAYNAEEEFNKLPPVVQKAVGSYHNLYDYSQMRIEDVQVTIKAHFKSVYDTELKRAREMRKIPQQIKERLEMGQKLMIEG